MSNTIKNIEGKLPVSTSWSRAKSITKRILKFGWGVAKVGCFAGVIYGCATWIGWTDASHSMSAVNVASSSWNYINNVCVGSASAVADKIDVPVLSPCVLSPIMHGAGKVFGFVGGAGSFVGALFVGGIREICNLNTDVKKSGMLDLSPKIIAGMAKNALHL